MLVVLRLRDSYQGMLSGMPQPRDPQGGFSRGAWARPAAKAVGVLRDGGIR